ncbi:MAG: metallophosphoesterase [Oscillospiraceae bacterium]|nr:metallophosphoesterase [Oscillospiraceae bacterium]
MRILVLSDSHRNKFACETAIKNQPNADIVVFLGDGEYDFDACRNLIRTTQVYAVRGNGDFYSSLPESQIIEVNNTRIYITHGYNERVKFDTQYLCDKVKDYDCKIGLYGHTHIQRYEYLEGVHLYCPGSLLHEEYGVVDITDSGIMCINMKCRWD